MKVKRCNYIPEGEIKIIEDMDTLIHNIVTPELKELQEENKQLKSILTDLEEYWENQQEHYRYIKDNRYRTFLSKNLNKIQELKEKYK